MHEDPVMILTIIPTVILWLSFLAVLQWVHDNSDAQLALNSSKR
jgi:hypothetical protein